MRHDPASAAVVVMLRALKMYGMAQAADSEANRSPFRFEIAHDSDLKSPTIPS